MLSATTAAGAGLQQKLLGVGFTPLNAHDTARLRLALSEQAVEAAERQARAAASGGGALAALRNEVIEALDKGGAVRPEEGGESQRISRRRSAAAAAAARPPLGVSLRRPFSLFCRPRRSRARSAGCARSRCVLEQP